MKIGIVGLGLIGGSIYKSISGDIVAVSKSQAGKADNIYDSYDVLKDCDVVFVCTPMNKTLEVLDELENVLSPDTIVTDVASVKEFVCEKEHPYKFIPSHPMAGTEFSGFENAFEGLFKGAKWVLTPLVRDESSDILEGIICSMGAIPVYATPKEHDEAVALISHMPIMAAQAVFLAAKDNELAMNLASSGFRDTTRLAMTNQEMFFDMLKYNSPNIKNAVMKCITSFAKLTGPEYPHLSQEIKDSRSRLY